MATLSQRDASFAEEEANLKSAGKARANAGSRRQGKIAKLRKELPKQPIFTRKTKTSSNDPKGYGRHEWGNPSGGITYPKKEDIEEQRRAIWEFIKQVGNVLQEGANLINTSLPVEIFEPRSYLERIPEPWAYAPFYLTRAALCDDPVERMKNVVCFIISGLQFNIEQKKPFNPILGETYQAKWHDGTELFLEQTAHRPPVSAWEVIGPEKCYRFRGYGCWSAAVRANSIKGEQAGEQVIEFHDGTSIRYTIPYMWMKGIVWGDRVIEYHGDLCFEDVENGIYCDITFNPDAKGFIRSMFSRSPHIPSDYFRGELYRKSSPEEEEKDVLHAVEGSWIACVMFDDEKYWDIEETAKHKATAEPSRTPLPSDARKREDRNELAAGDLESAREMKVLLEEKQRHDRRLRAEGKKNRS